MNNYTENRSYKVSPYEPLKSEYTHPSPHAYSISVERHNSETVRNHPYKPKKRQQ
ncbi:hypothetical protein K7432_011530, partial [Basidiobolus ranarum]